MNLMMVDVANKRWMEGSQARKEGLAQQSKVNFPNPNCRLPLQDYTNLSPRLGDLATEDQKKGMKRQQKRRVRKQHRETKGEGIDDMEDKRKGSKKRDYRNQEGQIDFKNVMWPKKKRRLE